MSQPTGDKNRITNVEKWFILFIANLFWSEREWNSSKCLSIRYYYYHYHYYHYYYYYFWSQDNSIGILIGNRMDDRGIRI
jgi:hypothetical protein